MRGAQARDFASVRPKFLGSHPESSGRCHTHKWLRPSGFCPGFPVDSGFQKESSAPPWNPESTGLHPTEETTASMTLNFAPEAIETWALGRLRPYARNAKTHGADQMAKIAASMAEFGWTVPVLVSSDGEVIVGHGRILAAAQLGIKEVPVIVLDHLSEPQRRAYRIGDNKLAELAGWMRRCSPSELAAGTAAFVGLKMPGSTVLVIGIPKDGT